MVYWVELYLLILCVSSLVSKRGLLLVVILGGIVNTGVAIGVLVDDNIDTYYPDNFREPAFNALTTRYELGNNLICI